MNETETRIPRIEKNPGNDKSYSQCQRNEQIISDMLPNEMKCVSKLQI